LKRRKKSRDSSQDVETAIHEDDDDDELEEGEVREADGRSIR
jgi:hypothetical protein